MKILKSLILVIFSLVFLFAQEPNAKYRMETSFNELEKNETCIFMLNAVTGDPIENVSVTIEGVGTYQTDFEGKLSFPTPADGDYIISGNSEGFIPIKSKLNITFASVFGNANIFAMSPVLPLEYIRIVLEWGDEPKDLDLHLVKNKKYHISYRNRKSSKDGKVFLDRDDMNGHGPETITIKKVDPNAEYTIYAHNYSQRSQKNLPTFHRSNARVSVYTNNQQQMVYAIPNGNGTYWQVLKIKNGEIFELNKISK